MHTNLRSRTQLLIDISSKLSDVLSLEAGIQCERHLAGRDVATLCLLAMLALCVNCKHWNAPLLHRNVHC